MDAEYGVMVLYWPGLMALIRPSRLSDADARIANVFSAFDPKAFLSGFRQTQPPSVQAFFSKYKPADGCPVSAEPVNAIGLERFCARSGFI